MKKIVISFFKIICRIRVMFYTLAARLRLCLFGSTKIGKEFTVSGWLNLHIRSDSKIIVADNVRINSGFRNNPVGGGLRTGIWVKRGAELHIGAGTGLSNVTIVSTASVKIGCNVFIGGDTSIYDTDFHPITVHGRHNNEPAQTAPVEIGNDVFVGGHCIILKGVRIGDGAVIGSGSVVSKDIPSNEVWAGNPVKFVKNLMFS